MDNCLTDPFLDVLWPDGAPSICWWEAGQERVSDVWLSLNRDLLIWFDLIVCESFFGKSDPFITISRARENGWVSTLLSPSVVFVVDWFIDFSSCVAQAQEVVHKTEVVVQDLNPVWRPFQIPLTKLCNGDMERPLMFEVHDWDSDGSTDFIGKFTVRNIAENVTVHAGFLEFVSIFIIFSFCSIIIFIYLFFTLQTNDRELGSGTRAWSLVNSEKKKNGGMAGVVKLLSFKVSTEYTWVFISFEMLSKCVLCFRVVFLIFFFSHAFVIPIRFLDFLAGGCEVSLMVAIDFTASNG
jgi:hypothetical protein